jgi:CRISPR-associated RAMP protein (TIGR02581 family)
MHKRLVNHCTIALSILPNGPILIKSGQEGANPTKPDMQFVETDSVTGKTIYLPGSSLKGAIRAHAERIVRTIGSSTRPTDASQVWASDPLRDDAEKYFKAQQVTDPTAIYQQSCFVGQLFGNTSIASRLRIEDAYPSGEVKLEERNGVAIDRVFGSVIPGGLFNYQVCTKGEFKTKIHLKNFTLAQLGLIGLVLRDLNDGWFGLGFAKSRGLGTVKVQYDKATVQYPGCVLNGDRRIQQLGTQQTWDATTLLGAGMFLPPEEAEAYGFPHPDQQINLPVAAQSMTYGLGVELVWTGTQVEDLFLRSVRSWGQQLTGAAT